MFSYFIRHKAGSALFLAIVVGCIASAVYFLYRGQKRVQHLYVPKLLMLRVDEVPFPKNGKRPIDVMTGTTIALTCESINPPAEMGRPDYIFHVGGKSYESKSCQVEVQIPGALFSTQKVSLDYLLVEPGGKSRVIDRYEALVRPIPAGQYFKIHTLGDRDGDPLNNLSAPKEAIPYVEAALNLEGAPEDYAVLFFVEAFGADFPVLQVVNRPRSEQTFEAVVAPLKRYRRFGPGVGGYAAWPKEPIQIGSPEKERTVFQVYAGLFKAEDVQPLVEQMLSYEGTTESGQIQVKAIPKHRAEIKALAWKGWLSDPVRVVRSDAATPGQKPPTPQPPTL